VPHHLFLCWKNDGGPSNDHGNGVKFWGRYGVEDRYFSIGYAIRNNLKLEQESREATLDLAMLSDGSVAGTA